MSYPDIERPESATVDTYLPLYIGRHNRPRTIDQLADDANEIQRGVNSLSSRLQLQQDALRYHLKRLCETSDCD